MELSQAADRLHVPSIGPPPLADPLAAPPAPPQAFGLPMLPGELPAPPPTPPCDRPVTVPTRAQPAAERAAPSLRMATWTPVFGAAPATEPSIAPTRFEPPQFDPPDALPPLADMPPATPGLVAPAHADVAIADEEHAAVADTGVTDELPADAPAPAVVAAAIPAITAATVAATVPAIVAATVPATSESRPEPAARRPLQPAPALLIVAVLAIGAFVVRSSRAEFIRDDFATAVLAEAQAADSAPETVTIGSSADSIQPAEPVPVAVSADEALQAASDGWLAWAAASPAATHPLVDATGEHCGANQPAEDVFFLAGSFGETVERVCQVPAGRSLVVPAINAWCDPTQAACGDTVRTATTSITLDGVEQPTFFRDAKALSIDAVPGNPIVAVDGPTQLTMSGEWAVIGPLEAGSHTVRISASTGQFALDVRYLLVVE